MGNKLTPRLVSVGAVTPVKLNSTHKRLQMLVKNVAGVEIGLTSDRNETTYADFYPLGDELEFVDVGQSDIYALSSSGTVNVWVWETEV